MWWAPQTIHLSYWWPRAKTKFSRISIAHSECMAFWDRRETPRSWSKVRYHSSTWTIGFTSWRFITLKMKFSNTRHRNLKELLMLPWHTTRHETLVFIYGPIWIRRHISFPCKSNWIHGPRNYKAGSKHQRTYQHGNAMLLSIVLIYTGIVEKSPKWHIWVQKRKR